MSRIVAAHLGDAVATKTATMIREFAERAEQSRALATDQLLNAIHIVTRKVDLGSDERQRVVELLLKELSPDTP
jgi:G3E family GTPase